MNIIMCLLQSKGDVRELIIIIQYQRYLPDQIAVVEQLDILNVLRHPFSIKGANNSHYIMAHFID